VAWYAIETLNYKADDWSAEASAIVCTGTCVAANKRFGGNVKDGTAYGSTAYYRFKVNEAN